MRLISNRSHRHGRIEARKQLNRFLQGTTLIEVLVTIVVFLVGILAIAQIFPGGVRILNRSRNTSMAMGLAKSTLESFAAKPESLPEQVVPLDVVDVGGVSTPVENPMRLPTDYSPTTTGGIDQTGDALGTTRNWRLVSGPNVFRRIIGEPHYVPAPRLLSTDLTSTTSPFGSLITLELGPPDHFQGAAIAGRFTAYGRDMAARLIRNQIDLNNLRDYEFGLANVSTSLASLNLPARPTSFPAARVDQFRVSFQAVIATGAGSVVRRVRSQLINVPADDTGFRAFPASSFPQLNMIAGETLVNIDPNSVRIHRVYTEIPAAQIFDPQNPYVFKTLNARIGQYLFNPALSQLAEERVGTPRMQPLVRFDYDLRDWRILHEDFRISQSNPPNQPKVLRLSMPSIATNSVAGADGRGAPNVAAVLAGNASPNAGMEDIFVVPSNVVAGASTDAADNILIIDTATGGQVLETFNGQTTLRIDKTAGTISLLDVTPNAGDPGLHAALAFADGSVRVANITGRNLRVYYMVKGEWAVQLTRSAAKYNSSRLQPRHGEYYVGGTGALSGLPTRLYFPTMDNNRKVAINKIRYIYNTPGGPMEGLLEGAEFQIRFRPGSETISISMPSVDIRDVIPGAIGFAQGEQSVAGVQGISILAKAFNNPNAFSLGPNAVTNQTGPFREFQGEYNIVTKETFLPRGGTVR